MEKMNKGILWGVIASESIHVFCCVLPTVFSVISLLAGMGMVAAMPGFIEVGHELIHDYEIPMIIVSGAILVFGWGLYIYSRKMNCSEEGTCCHTPCAPKKDMTRKVMIAATILFIVNVCVYFIFHHSGESDIMHDQSTIHAEHNHHDHHDH